MTLLDLSHCHDPRLRTALSLLSLAPRLLVPMGSLLAALLGAASCVPETRYEEAQSAADVQGEALRRAALELEAQKARVRDLEAELRAREQKLDANDQSLEEAKLERTAIEKQRDDTASLVEQLRGELARVGEHLHSFSAEKAELERELAKSREPADGVDPLLVALARDVGLAAGAANLGSAVSLSTRDGALVLVVRADALFEKESAAPRPLAPAAFDAAARVLAREQRLSGVVREIELDGSLPAALGAERRGRMEASLRARGIGDRVRFSAADPAAGTPLAYEVVLTAARGDAAAEAAAPAPE